jgi:hypothetical protein
MAMDEWRLHEWRSDHVRPSPGVCLSLSKILSVHLSTPDWERELEWNTWLGFLRSMTFEPLPTIDVTRP